VRTVTGVQTCALPISFYFEDKSNVRMQSREPICPRNKRLREYRRARGESVPFPSRRLPRSRGLWAKTFHPRLPRLRPLPPDPIEIGRASCSERLHVFV